ncbi:ATP-binding protein [Desulfosporosinus sp. BG]|uniref:sensor histidine kinase n=1 Tax=Desulfosporosinus sp. BG TaxID=1633135 RepID=UPI00083AFC5F|nr:ATP-binding protein [Desulfosporosinus sp. BG]ODA40852.1 Two-component sensor histidine kinase, malate [Desulfosporosinus sp. BG]
MNFDIFIFDSIIWLLSLLIVIQPFNNDKSTKTFLRFLLISLIIISYDILIFLIDPLAWQSTFFTLLAFLLTILCLAFALKIDFSTAIILSGIHFIIFIITETISYSVLKLIIPHQTLYDSMLVISTYIVIIVIIILIRITVLRKFYKILKEKIKNLKNYAIVVLNCYVIFSFLKELAHKNNSFSLYAVSILMVIISSIYLVKELMDNRSLQGLILSHQKLIEAVQPIIQDIKSNQHDFRNQLNVIRLRLCSEVDFAKTSEQLDELLEEMTLVDSFTSFGGSSVSSLLYLKNKEAICKNIQFVINRPPFSGLSHQLTEYELISVLSNLIDNAIEATSQFSGEKKVIVSFKPDENGTLISVANTGNSISPHTLSKLFKRGFSTKCSEESEKHGYGLYNVKKILDPYGGRMEVLCEANVTTFQFHLKLAASNAS